MLLIACEDVDTRVYSPQQRLTLSYSDDMSCIRFNTAPQRAQMRALVDENRSDDPVAQFLSPAVTDSKITRLRAMAKDPNPKIRESVALSYHAPDEIYEALAKDPVASVRECLARNPKAPCDVLRTLASDSNERVRSFVAVNYWVPEDAMEKLAEDPSELVRSLVHWKSSLKDEALQPA